MGLRKFWRARNTPKVLLKHTPFPFYVESTLRVAACSSDLTSCDGPGLRGFYHSWKSAHSKEWAKLFKPRLPWHELFKGAGEFGAASNQDPLLSAMGTSNKGNTSCDSAPGTCVWRPTSSEDEFFSFW